LSHSTAEGSYDASGSAVKIPIKVAHELHVELIQFSGQHQRSSRVLNFLREVMFGVLVFFSCDCGMSDKFRSGIVGNVGETGIHCLAFTSVLIYSKLPFAGYSNPEVAKGIALPTAPLRLEKPQRSVDTVELLFNSLQNQLSRCTLGYSSE
jgi:hypothetical protein